MPCSTAAVAFAIAVSRAACFSSGVARGSIFGLYASGMNAVPTSGATSRLAWLAACTHSPRRARASPVAEHGDGVVVHAGDVDGHEGSRVRRKVEVVGAMIGAPMRSRDRSANWPTFIA